jgi:hypothetical protein
MYAAEICPPTGPWPMPPWCSGIDRPTGTSSTAGQEVNAQPATQLPTPNPYPPENTWGYVAPTPTLPAGSEVEIRFEVSLPRSEDPIELNLGGEVFPLTAVSEYYFVSDPLPSSAGETLEYYYSSGELQTAIRTVTVNSDYSVRDGLQWTDVQAVGIPGFIKGYGTMDFGGFNVSELRGGRFPSILASMQQDGAEWYMFDHYWSYTDYSIPEIVDESVFPDMQYPNHEDLARMAAEAHQQGLKFILLTSLEWSAIPGNPCYQYHGDAEKLAECSNNYWLEGREYEVSMRDRLEANPDDPEALAYRERWFEAYEKYLLDVAGVAQENGVEMIIIGKNTAFANSPIHESHWRDLIGKIRAVYQGRLGLIYECYDDSCLNGKPWVDDMDAAVIFYWFRLSEADAPSEEVLRAEMTRINQRVISPFYSQYQKPVIVMTPFMSRDHPARQDWVEPASSAPGVGRDLIGQAELYQLLFETSLDQPWFSGVIPYGYWFFDGFHPDFAFDRSYNVRSKPASLVLRSWFALVDSGG